MNAESAAKLISFAEALSKLKNARDLRHESVTLTRDEIDGIIYGVMTLRGNDDTAAS